MIIYNLFAYEIGGQAIGIDLLTWNDSDLSGNTEFSASTATTITGYANISSATTWNNLGDVLGFSYTYIRDRIISFTSGSTWSGLTNEIKDAVSSYHAFEFNLSSTTKNDVVSFYESHFGLPDLKAIDLYDERQLDNKINLIDEQGVGSMTATTYHGITLLTNTVKPDFIDLGTGLTNPSYLKGRLFYHDTDEALAYYNDVSNVTMQLGQESWIRVTNSTGSLISNGSAVYINGGDSVTNTPTIALAKADSINTSGVIGITTHDIENNTQGYITFFGKVNDLNTTAFTEGDTLYLSDITAGKLINNAPSVPSTQVKIATVIKTGSTNGSIFIANAKEIRQSPIFAQLSDSINQKPIQTTPTLITFNTNDEISGMTHTLTGNTGDIKANVAGGYVVVAQPQVEKTGAGTDLFFHCWLRKGRRDGNITDVAISTGGTITSSFHRIQNGQQITITGVTTSPDINGVHTVTGVTRDTFDISVNITGVTDGVGTWIRGLDVNDDVQNSNVELNLQGTGQNDVIPLFVNIFLEIDDVLQVYQSISDSTKGAGLVAKFPSKEPVIPSIIMTVTKIGD